MATEAQAQQLVTSGSGAPAGFCNNLFYVDYVSGLYYSCVGGSWSVQTQGLVPQTFQVNGHALIANVTVSATDLTTGTLSAARLPAFGSGDVSFASGGGAGTIASGAVTNAKLASQAYGFPFTTYCTGGSMLASSTVFMPGFGGVLNTCTGLGTTRTSGLSVSAGTIKNLRVNLGTGGKAGDAVTVEIAGVASALTCTFGTGTSCNDVTHTAAVTAGQVLTIKVTTGTSETAANIVVYFELWP